MSHILKTYSAYFYYIAHILLLKMHKFFSWHTPNTLLLCIASFHVITCQPAGVTICPQ